MSSLDANRTLTRRSLFAAVALTAVSLAACSSPAPAGQPTSQPASTSADKPATGQPATSAPTVAAAGPTGRLSVALTINPTTLDPGTLISGPGLAYYSAVYDTLTVIDQNGQLHPSLATSWEQTSPTSWRFVLRQGVKFHNGDPFDAEAVRFTIERSRDPNNKLNSLAPVSSIQEVKIVDPYTIDLITSAPDVLLPKSLAQVMIGNGKYFGSAGEEAYALKPVGTGPFRLTRLETGTVAEYEAFEEFWGPKPGVRELSIKPVPESAARIAALLSGEVDIIDEVSTDLTGQITSAGKKIAWSYSGSVACFGLNYNEPWFADKRVRQAVNYAVNKESLVQNLLGGYARAAEGQLMHSECFGFNPNVKGYEYDPDRARQLLDEAGYPNGFETEAHVISVVGGNKEAGEAVAADLAQVGIKMNVRLMERAVWLDEFFQRTPRPGMIFHTLNYDPALDARFVFVYWSKDSAIVGPIWEAPAEWDQLWDQQKSESDPAKREQMLQRMSAIMREEAPSLFLWQNQRLYGIQPNIEWQPGPASRVDLRLARKV